MSSAASPTSQAEAEKSHWFPLVSSNDVQGIHRRIKAAQGDEKRKLLKDGLLYSAAFGSTATTNEFLEHRASVSCFDNHQRTPLLRSIELNKDEEVAVLLIKHGAAVNLPGYGGTSALNRPEYGGRTPLMQCIWKNRMTVFDTLMRTPGIRVDVRDMRGRNALHHLVRDLDRTPGDSERKKQSGKKDEYTIEILNKLIEKNGNIVNEQDESGRTGLHWTALHGTHSLVELLLAAPDLKHDALFEKDQQGRSPLHIAAAKEHFKVLTTMLKSLKKDDEEDFHYPRINDKSTGDWTVLHLVLRSSEPPMELVQDLVEHGADINRCVQDGKNALHLAALTGNINLVRFMLEQPLMHRLKRDDFGDTPFLCAARGQHQPKPEPELLKLFAPWDPSFKPKRSSDADIAARTTLLRPVIYEFDKERGAGKGSAWRELYTSDQLTVHDIIYATEPDKPSEPSLKTVSDGGSFQWIHLPANSITWCLDLVTKHYIEHRKEGDVHGLQELERAFALHERRNRNPHLSYMSPICGVVSKMDAGTTTSGVRQYYASDLGPDLPAIVSRGSWNIAGSAAASRERSRWTTTIQRLKQIRRDRLDDAWPPPLQTSESARAKPEEVTESPKATNKPKRDTTDISSMYLFMPYIHHEFTADQKEMFELAKSICDQRELDPTFSQRSRTWPVEDVRGVDAKKRASRRAMNRALIQSHFAEPNPNTLHLRRTLDQYYYQAIDTRERDEDQAGQRAQRRRHVKQREDDKKAYHCCLEKEFRCSDHAQKSSTHPRFRAWVKSWTLYFTAKPGINSDSKEPCASSNCKSCSHPGDIESLMIDQLWILVLKEDLVITSFPAAWAADSGQSDMLRRIIDFIRSNNGDKVDSVHELAQLIAGQFYGSYRQLVNEEKYEFLGTYLDALGVIKEKEIKMLKEFIPNPPATSAHVATLKDVTQEMKLLEEVKDIYDELSILDMVLEAQEHVQSQVNDAVVAWTKGTTDEKKQRVNKMCMDHRRAIRLPRREIDNMLAQSAQIEQSIFALLDLKQKHANSLQAYSTLRSGTTLMIFTTVTIIFLPLTFISSFFTIEISEFPRDDMGVNMPASYVMTWVFGLGGPIALVLLIVALNAETTATNAREIWQKANKKLDDVAEKLPPHDEYHLAAGVALSTRPQPVDFKRTWSYDLEAAMDNGSERDGRH